MTPPFQPSDGRPSSSANKRPATNYLPTPPPSKRQKVSSPSSSDDELWSHFVDADEWDCDEIRLPSSPPVDLAEVEHILNRTFRLTAFRPGQMEAIEATLRGRDVFSVMPTGGGKSLTFQLPAIHDNTTRGGMTLVISPLISLVLDQVMYLRGIDVDVEYFASNISEEYCASVWSRLVEHGPKPALLFITPEKLACDRRMMGALKHLHSEQKLSRMVIDEAHLICTWGKDFREDYAKLKILREEFPNVPMMALTATATSKDRSEIVRSLGLRTDYLFLSRSLHRANLRYTVHTKNSTVAETVIQDIATFIRTEHEDDAGIVYCNRKERCEQVARKLQHMGLNAKHFHSDMEVSEKKDTLTDWHAGDCNIIVGTVAFGLGINKLNVRFVIHSDIPSSLLSYMHETGHAGRDGKRADCVLYYSSDDCKRRIAAIQHDAAPEMQRLIELVQEVERFCRNNVDCRQFQLLARFEEAFNPEDCAASCDNCAVTGHSLFSSQHGSPHIKEKTSDGNDGNDDDDTRTRVNPSMTPPPSSISLDDLQGRCYAELVALDRMILEESGDVKAGFVFNSESLQMLSCILPRDCESFRSALSDQDARDFRTKWTAYGYQFLAICVKFAKLHDSLER